MWSGRFREPLDPAFEQWQRSFPFDVRLLPQEVAASKAHARAIAAAGVLAEAELEKMLDGLDLVISSALEEVGSSKLDAQSCAAIAARHLEAEDIHHFVE